MKKLKHILALVLVWVIPHQAAAQSGISDIDCVIEPHMTVELSSPVQGVLDEVTVKRGDRVKKGQVLARLKSDVEEAGVKLERARAEAKAQIKADRVRYELSKRSLIRTNELFKKNMVSKNEQDEAESLAAVRELEISRTKEANELAWLELNRAIEILKLRSILSPIDGVVVERYKSPGEYVEEQPILKLVQVDPLNVEVILPLSWLGSVKLGMKAKVMLEKPVGGVYNAEVIIVDPVVDAASGTFGVRLELPNPKYQISSGLRCDIKFLMKRTKRRK